MQQELKEAFRLYDKEGLYSEELMTCLSVIQEFHCLNCCLRVRFLFSISKLFNSVWGIKFQRKVLKMMSGLKVQGFWELHFLIFNGFLEIKNSK